MITIWLNGESRDVPDGLTLQALLEWLKLPVDRVAVERNMEIVPRARWRETTIVDGDRLEVVHFVGGGSPARSHCTFSSMACRFGRRGRAG